MISPGEVAVHSSLHGRTHAAYVAISSDLTRASALFLALDGSKIRCLELEDSVNPIRFANADFRVGVSR